jgi:hypothetical protein
LYRLHIVAYVIFNVYIMTVKKTSNTGISSMKITDVNIDQALINITQVIKFTHIAFIENIPIYLC